MLSRTRAEISLILLGVSFASAFLGCERVEEVTVKQQALRVWSAGEAYLAGEWVSYQGQTYVAIQGHASQTGWEPPNVSSLWRLEEFSGTPSSGKIEGTPSLDDVTMLYDCERNPTDCCFVGSDVQVLGSGDDVLFNTLENKCVVSGSGRDTIHLQSSGASSLFLGADDDTAMDGPGDNLIMGGSGRDTIHGHGGTNLFFGGYGSDVIFAANGTNRVIPGPGADTVDLTPNTGPSFARNLA